MYISIKFFRPILSILLAIFTPSLFAQSSGVPYPSDRQSTYELYGYRSNIKGETNGELVIVDPNIRFSIIDEIIRDSTKFYLIRIWNKKLPKESASTEKKAEYQLFQAKYLPDSIGGSGKSSELPKNQLEQKLFNYILVESSLIEKNTIQLYSKRFEPVAGPLVIPVKLRSSPFDFSTDISFGAAVGSAVRTSRQVENNRLYFLLSGGITAITIDSISTEGEVTESMDFPGFYMAAGAVLSLRNSFSLGLFVGVDYLSARNRNNWIYQGKPWVGVGIGISMFQLNKEDQSTLNKVQSP